MPIWNGKLACIPLLQWLSEDGISVSKRIVMSYMVYHGVHMLDDILIVRTCTAWVTHNKIFIFRTDSTPTRFCITLLQILPHNPLWPFRDQRDIYVPLTKSIFKSSGITVPHFFSMLPSTWKYLYSVEPVRMHFPAKQPCTNDTVCNAGDSRVVFVVGPVK